MLTISFTIILLVNTNIFFECKISPTHVECSENCKSMGGGFCVSPSTYSCCPYFGKEDGLCVDECSTTVNSTSHCTDECEGHWSGDNCKSKLLGNASYNITN